MADYIKERQIIASPFHCNQTFPNRPNPSPFANLCKAAPKRRGTAKATLKKMRKNYVPNIRATFPQPKEEQMKATFNVVAPVTAKPAMVAATPTSSTTSTPPVSTER